MLHDDQIFRPLHMNSSIWTTVTAEIKAASQKFVIPKENRHNSTFSFGITHFWGAAFISAVTVIMQNSLKIRLKNNIRILVALK